MFSAESIPKLVLNIPSFECHMLNKNRIRLFIVNTNIKFEFLMAVKVLMLSS
jgi:hypothetical protein